MKSQLGWIEGLWEEEEEEERGCTPGSAEFIKHPRQEAKPPEQGLMCAQRGSSPELCFALLSFAVCPAGVCLQSLGPREVPSDRADVLPKPQGDGRCKQQR